LGRRKRLLREKRRAKHQKAAMAAFQYRVRLAIKEYFRMKKQKDTYLDRLTKASLKRDPLPMAVITYQAFRDSDAAMILKEADNQMNYDAEAWGAIVKMAKILEQVGWENDQVKKFIEKSKELAGIDNEKQNDI
jgi:hypothetical protein